MNDYIIPNLKRDKNKIALLVIAIILFVVYKLWKFFFIERFMGVLPYEHYYGHQFLLTIYRVIATIIGSLIFFKFYHNPKSQLKINIHNKYLWIFSAHLVTLFCLRFLFNDFSFLSIKSFLFEIFFNLFTGSWEELIFKGMLLIGLYKITNKKYLSIIICAIVFSLWHYDVVFHNLKFISIFTWALFSSICFFNGASLLLLIIYHFVWDQICFGFLWQNIINETWYISSLIVVDLIFILFVLNIKNISLKYKKLLPTLMSSGSGHF